MTELNDCLEHLSTAGLISIQRESGEAEETYEIHPVVASVGRAQASADYRQAGDVRLATYWEKACHNALKKERKGGSSRQVRNAAIAAIPYYLRQGDTQSAALLLDEVLLRDKSRATARIVRPSLIAVVNAASGLAKAVAASSLAHIVDRIGVSDAEAEATLQEALEAEYTDDFGDGPVTDAHRRAFSALASNKIERNLHAGRHGEAMRVAEEQIDLAKQLGLGPWSQLGADVTVLKIKTAMGQYGIVLREVNRLRSYMGTLPAVSSEPETTTPWYVREELLAVGQQAAIDAKEWQLVLEFNAAIIASMRNRDANPADVAMAIFSGHSALAELDRADEARDRLIECRELAEADRDYNILGVVLSALAQLEALREHLDVAIELERNALRYKYLANDVQNIPISHYGFANFSDRYAGRRGTATPHYLACALIHEVTASPHAETYARLGEDVRDRGEQTVLPADVTELCRQVGQVPGVDLASLLDLISPDPDTAQRRLDGVIAEAHAWAKRSYSPPEGPVQPEDLPRYFAMWDPVIAGIVATARGNKDASAALYEHLTKIEQAETEWAPLASALRHISQARAGGTLTRHVALMAGTADALPILAADAVRHLSDKYASGALRARLAKIEGAARTWPPFAGVFRSSSAKRDWNEMTAGLEGIGTLILSRARDALDGKVVIPAALWVAMPWGYSLAGFVAAGRGDADAAVSAETELETFRQRNRHAEKLCSTLKRVIAGDHDPALAPALEDPGDRAIVVSVLQHINSA